MRAWAYKLRAYAWFQVRWTSSLAITQLTELMTSFFNVSGSCHQTIIWSTLPISGTVSVVIIVISKIVFLKVTDHHDIHSFRQCLCRAERHCKCSFQSTHLYLCMKEKFTNSNTLCHNNRLFIIVKHFR